MMKRTFALLMFVLSVISLQAGELIIALALSDENPIFHRIEKLLNEAVDSLDGETLITLNTIPFERAVYNLTRGDLDGDVLRTDLTYMGNSSVIKVSPAILHIPYYIYVREDYEIEDFDSLQKHRMAIQDGNILVEDFARTEGIRFTSVIDNSHAIRMLALDRADFFIASGMEGDLVFSELLIRNGVVRSDDPVFSTELFLFLHKRHESLARSLEPVLEDMKKSGRILEILSGSP